MKLSITSESKSGKCISVGEIAGKNIKIMIVQPMDTERTMFAVLDYGVQERISSDIREGDLVVRVRLEDETILWQKR